MDYGSHDYVCAGGINMTEWVYVHVGPTAAFYKVSSKLENEKGSLWQYH